MQSNYKEDKWGNPVSLILADHLRLRLRLRRIGAIVELTVDKSSARWVVARGPERGKLKNLHC
jgi:hypothetical protein